MSLQYKISALLLAVFSLFGIFIYAVQQHVILPSFLELETHDAKLGMERAVQAIGRETTALAQPARDWASWNDTYQFLADHNAQFRDTHLTRIGVFDLLDADLLYLVDTAGEVVWSVAYDRRSGEEIHLAELSDTHISPSHPLTARAGENASAEGLLNTAFGPLMLVSQPVLDSDGQGPSRGNLILGRFLDASTIDRISLQAGVQLAVWPLKDAALDTEQADVLAELKDTNNRGIRKSAEENRLYQVMPDIFGEPALLLQVKAPRLISAEGGIVNRHARFALAIGALLILLVLLVGLRRLVLHPIAELIQHAEEVGRHDDLLIRLDADRDDELGELAHKFNEMVERLADTRRELVEQSHQAGIAELASGVLHNIGNAITPIKVRVANIETTLRQAPVVELDMALKELDDPATPSERRTDLREFADLAAREFGALLTITVDQIVGIAKQVEHVQKILNDQESVSRAGRVLRPVDVARLADDAVKLLGSEVLNSLEINIDRSVKGVEQVLGSPVALQQVVVNLLKNSAESIRACSPPPPVGRIALTAAADHQSGRDMIRLSVTDNGGGISAENILRVFERGYTTKSRPTSGRGMHWCSITAAALGGQITIDSAGVGQGATVSLWLPRA